MLFSRFCGASRCVFSESFFMVEAPVVCSTLTISIFICEHDSSERVSVCLSFALCGRLLVPRVMFIRVAQAATLLSQTDCIASSCDHSTALQTSPVI